MQRTYRWFTVVGFFQMVQTCNFLPELSRVSHPCSPCHCTARYSRHPQSTEVLTWWDGHAMLLWWFCSWPSTHQLLFPSWNFYNNYFAKSEIKHISSSHEYCSKDGSIQNFILTNPEEKRGEKWESLWVEEISGVILILLWSWKLEDDKVKLGLFFT